MAWFDTQAGKPLPRKQQRINGLVQGDNTLVAAVADTKLIVLALRVENQQASAETLIWKSGATALREDSLAATTGQIEQGSEDGVLEAAAGAALVLNAGTASPNLEGRITYVEVPT